MRNKDIQRQRKKLDKDIKKLSYWLELCVYEELSQGNSLCSFGDKINGSKDFVGLSSVCSSEIFRFFLCQDAYHLQYIYTLLFVLSYSMTCLDCLWVKIMIVSIYDPAHKNYLYKWYFQLISCIEQAGLI